MSLPRFAALLDRLVYAPGRNQKLELIAAYLKSTPDPDRGWALAALTGGLDIKAVQPSVIRGLMETRVDPVLFGLSYDYVGDLAETCALLWPEETLANSEPGLGETIDHLKGLKRGDVASALAALLDRLDAGSRWALLKLATGGLRVGVSARLAKTALAQAFSLDPHDIEQMWHGLAPPYASFFAWATGAAPPPDLTGQPVFRTFMLAHPLPDDAELDVGAFQLEWKWDGIRVQAVRTGDQTRLYSRTGDDIGASFPDVAAAITRQGVYDGELLVRASDGEVGSFNDLQQRLGRKTPPARLIAERPAMVRLYDVLVDGAEDVRHLPLSQRRARLERLIADLPSDRFDLSAVLTATTWADARRLRVSAPHPAIEGLMFKRRDSRYEAGRKAGLWYKWKRDPLTADCVLMYAQRGHGKRSSFYSDFTFGCPDAQGVLLPVGKAYFGFTDEELAWLDRFVRNNTVNRFGPVREVAKTLVLEIAFDAIQRSSRHKSGLAMRFPRIARIRADKPAQEATPLEELYALALNGFPSNDTTV